MTTAIHLVNNRNSSMIHKHSENILAETDGYLGENYLVLETRIHSSSSSSKCSNEVSSVENDDNQEKNYDSGNRFFSKEIKNVH